MVAREAELACPELVEAHFAWPVSLPLDQGFDQDFPAHHFSHWTRAGRLIYDFRRSCAQVENKLHLPNPANQEKLAKMTDTSLRTTIAPWLSVRGGARAVAFYQAAFGAIEVYRLEDPGGGVVARLSVDGAEFWVSEESADGGNLSPQPLAGESVRMILTVADPDAAYNRARKAGATEVFPVGEQYGWRLGRVVDPFGHHWEIGRPLS